MGVTDVSAGWVAHEVLYFFVSSGLTLQDLFVDLNKSCDYKYNEYVLKYFFLSADPLLREDVTAQYLFIYIFLVAFHRSMFQYF